jgi:preprotein translocase subunit SecF
MSETSLSLVYLKLVLTISMWLVLAVYILGVLSIVGYLTYLLFPSLIGLYRSWRVSRWLKRMVGNDQRVSIEPEGSRMRETIGRVTSAKKN